MSSHSQQQAVACIVLAAGSSKRFGSDKRQALLADGKTLLQTTLASIPDIFSQRLLVLHPGDESLTLAHQPDWSVVIAQTAAAGMGHSVAAGVKAAKHCMGVLIVLADMPAIAPLTFLSVVRELKPGRIVVPRIQGKRGNPVALGSDFFPELEALQGDTGARSLIEKYQQAVVWVECEDTGILGDIDTPEELKGHCNKPG